jgi:pimeloyl-ACP methyl ester carboxylesterase
MTTVAPGFASLNAGLRIELTPATVAMPFIDIRNRRLDYERIEVAPAGSPTLVFLHEGIGSVAMWRDFPGRVVHATGCNALVYSRCGYGNSEPLREPRAVGYMHDEALVVLPELLDALGLARPILVGHSDGASIALIHAGGAARPVAGLVLLAPHVLVEDVSIASIAAAKVAYETTDLRARLARYHADVDSAFWGWNRIWLAPGFRQWNIEEYLPRIACPVLAIQGKDDEYGTMDQLRRIGTQVADAELVELADCRHSPHKDQPDAVIAAITRFVDRITGRA